MEKKYAIHILAVSAINGETFDLPQEQNAIIVCTDEENEHIYQCLSENILIINFPDVKDKNYPNAFNREHAKRIIHFVQHLSEKVTDIYVCCTQGSSRSAAVAAALLRMSGRSDKAVWCNPYYAPNTLVYSNLCREYGILTTGISVKIRELMNKRAFKAAKKGKKLCYERWQILD